MWNESITTSIDGISPVSTAITLFSASKQFTMEMSKKIYRCRHSRRLYSVVATATVDKFICVLKTNFCQPNETRWQKQYFSLSCFIHSVRIVFQLHPLHFYGSIFLVSTLFVMDVKWLLLCRLQTEKESTCVFSLLLYLCAFFLCTHNTHMMSTWQHYIHVSVFKFVFFFFESKRQNTTEKCV